VKPVNSPKWNEKKRPGALEHRKTKNHAEPKNPSQRHGARPGWLEIKRKGGKKLHRLETHQKAQDQDFSQRKPQLNCRGRCLRVERAAL